MDSTCCLPKPKTFGLVCLLISVRGLCTPNDDVQLLQTLNCPQPTAGCRQQVRLPWSGSRFSRGSSLALTVVTQLSWSGAHRVTASAELAAPPACLTYILTSRWRWCCVVPSRSSGGGTVTQRPVRGTRVRFGVGSRAS